MAKVREEDLRMKIPAMLHLTRLGYRYLPPKMVERDPLTNIEVGTLKDAMRRMYSRFFTPEMFARMVNEIREMLNLPDQGEAFYRVLRDGWNGFELIDYAHPERNEFHVVPELNCKAGKRSFRPDITLMVNGLPLAMIEVKTEKQGNGIRAEYDRMMDRYRNPDFRRFLQGAQIWAFSDNRKSDENRFLPTEGASFATASEGDFPLRVFRDARGSGTGHGLPPVNRETEKCMLMDLGMAKPKRGQAYRQALSPDTPTHRMLTALFSPERFLFLIRYGIQYETTGEEGKEQTHRKNLVTAEQYFTLWEAKGKIERGFRNWNITSPGAAGESAMIASLMELLQEKIPGSRVYWVAANRTELLTMDAALRELGFRPGRRTRMAPEQPVLMEPGEHPGTWLRDPAEREFGGRRIFFLPSPHPGTERMQQFTRRLRGADPEAIIIRFTRSAEPERGGNFTYLLECADGTLYCGWTNDLAQRLQAHNQGRGAKYTRGRGPVRLAYYEEFATREEAMSREWHLKQLSREEKQRLIAAWQGEKQHET